MYSLSVVVANMVVSGLSKVILLPITIAFSLDNFKLFPIAISLLSHSIFVPNATTLLSVSNL
jgi:hypothetical protein